MSEPGPDIELVDVRKSRKAQHKYDAIFEIVMEDGKLRSFVKDVVKKA